MLKMGKCLNRYLVTLWLLVAISITPGCMILPAKENILDEGVLQGLIGSDMDVVESKLGKSRYRIEKPGKTYLQYTGYIGIGYVYFYPIATAGDFSLKYCYLLQFGAEGVLEKYYTNTDDGISDCIESLHEAITRNLLDKALQGDAEAQWHLYKDLRDENSLKWLCRAADQGHIDARKKLGELYLHGNDPKIKTTGITITASNSKSCMWYHLAGITDIINKAGSGDHLEEYISHDTVELELTARGMSPQDISSAEDLITAWEPGQCLKEIFYHSAGENVDYSYYKKLCDKADRGDSTSRDWLARTYYGGIDRIRTDYPRAYMWYYLAAEAYQLDSLLAAQEQCNSLSNEEHSDLVKMLNDWAPGTCEQDLIKR